MDEEHIENRLRQSWSPEPPQEMRDRVLRNARQELHSRRTDSGGWRYAAVALGLMIVLAANISDFARQNRLSGMTHGSMGAVSASAVEPQDRNFLQWRLEIQKMLAVTPVEASTFNSREGDELL